MMENIRRITTFVLLVQFNAAFGQDENQPFVTVPREKTNLSNETSKIYTTQLQLQLSKNDTLNEEIFLNAAKNYYGNLSDGFHYINVTDDTAREINNFTIYRITYKVAYNYNSLNESVKGSDDAISSTIGNVTALKNALEQDNNFTASNYSVIEDGFNFSGSAVCDSCGGDCCQANMECIETTKGISVWCVSICQKDPLFCYNGGYCMHAESFQKPICSCPAGQYDWYVGGRCQSHLNVWMPIVFFVIAFLLISLVLALTCYCVRTLDERLEKERQTALKKANGNSAGKNPKQSSKNKKVLISLSSALRLKKKSKRASARNESPAATAINQVSPPLEETNAADNTRRSTLSHSSQAAGSAESTHEPHSTPPSSAVSEAEAPNVFSYNASDVRSQNAFSERSSSLSSSTDAEERRIMSRLGRLSQDETREPSEHAYATVVRKELKQPKVGHAV